MTSNELTYHEDRVKRPYATMNRVASYASRELGGYDSLAAQLTRVVRDSVAAENKVREVMRVIAQGE